MLRGAVSGPRLERLAGAAERALAACRAGLAGWPEGSGVFQLPRLRAFDADLLAPLREGLAERAAALLGTPRVQLLQDVLIHKPAGREGAVGLHDDASYFGYLDRPAALSIRIALTPQTEAGGCLYVVDGSHRWERPPRSDAPPGLIASDAAAGLPPELRSRVAAATRSLELAPGDATLHHCLLLHGSHPNRAGGDLRSLVFHLCDGLCRLDRARVPAGAEALFHADADGHLDARSFPVLFDAGAR